MVSTADSAAWLSLDAGRPFYEAILEREGSHAWRAEDVVLLIAGECDLILMDRPNAHGYQGLTQIGKNELRALGWRDTWGPFCQAAPDVQIEYTGRYFQGWRERLGLERWESAGALWAANLAPAHSKRVDRVVYAELEHPAQYRANKWLDLNGDGVIHREELTEALRTKAVPRCRIRYDLAIRNLAKVRAETGPRPPRDYSPLPAQSAVIAIRPRRGGGEPPDVA
jgi:pimeloyl-ACP methyl ester carboxylesterase